GHRRHRYRREPGREVYGHGNFPSPTTGVRGPRTRSKICTEYIAPDHRSQLAGSDRLRSPHWPGTGAPDAAPRVRRAILICVQIAGSPAPAVMLSDEEAAAPGEGKSTHRRHLDLLDHATL